MFNGHGVGRGIWRSSLRLPCSLRQRRVARESLKGFSLTQQNPSLLPFHWLKLAIYPWLARGLKIVAFHVPKKKEYRIGFGEHSTVSATVFKTLTYPGSSTSQSIVFSNSSMDLSFSVSPLGKLVFPKLPYLVHYFIFSLQLSPGNFLRSSSSMNYLLLTSRYIIPSSDLPTKPETEMQL